MPMASKGLVWDAHHEWKPSNGGDWMTGWGFANPKVNQNAYHCLSIVMFKNKPSLWVKRSKAFTCSSLLPKIKPPTFDEHGQTKPTEKVCPANEFFVGASISFRGGLDKSWICCEVFVLLGDFPWFNQGSFGFFWRKNKTIGEFLKGGMSTTTGGKFYSFILLPSGKVT